MSKRVKFGFSNTSLFLVANTLLLIGITQFNIAASCFLESASIDNQSTNYFTTSTRKAHQSSQAYLTSTQLSILGDIDEAESLKAEADAIRLEALELKNQGSLLRQQAEENREKCYETSAHGKRFLLIGFIAAALAVLYLLRAILS